MKVILTGANGFLGWHFQIKAQALYPELNIVPLSRDNFDNIFSEVADCDAIVHLAGANRGGDEYVYDENIAVAKKVAESLVLCKNKIVFVYANSMQKGTLYRESKDIAADILKKAVDENGGKFKNVFLTNVFGENCKPNYNSFVATFIDKILSGDLPEINDNLVNLIHAQDACEALIQSLIKECPDEVHVDGKNVRVSDIYSRLLYFNDLYSIGEIPKLVDDFDINLFNTFRFRSFEKVQSFSINNNIDDRGNLAEIIKTHGSSGQVYFSNTFCNKTRGEHFHIRKIERFIVIKGNALIQLRKKFSNDVINISVSGDKMIAIDMPTMYIHNIKNIGESELTTLFWSHSLYNKNDTDTYYEKINQ